MPFATTTIIAIAGTALAAAGTVQQMSATKDASRASKEAEAIRRKQLELENVRKQRAIIRQAQAARAQAVASASARGAVNSDVLPGAIGQIATQSGAQLLAQSENTALSFDMFDANAQQAEARARAATGGAMIDFGKTLFGNAETISNVGKSTASFFSNNTWDTSTKLGNWETLTEVGK
jgi:hypothetical protein